MRRARVLIQVGVALCVAGAFAACGDNGKSCTVDIAAQADANGQSVIDCGDFVLGSVNYTDDSMLAAQECVLNAIGGGRAFRLVYDATDTVGQVDSGLRAAFTGAVTPSQLSLHSYAGNVAGDMTSSSAVVTERTCSSLEATASCTPRVGIPCLSCGGDSPGTLVCDG